MPQRAFYILEHYVKNPIRHSFEDPCGLAPLQLLRPAVLLMSWHRLNWPHTREAWTFCQWGCIMRLLLGGCPLSVPACVGFWGVCTLERARLRVFPCLNMSRCVFEYASVCALPARFVNSLFVCVCVSTSYSVSYIYSAHLCNGLPNGNERDFIHKSPMQISQ